MSWYCDKCNRKFPGDMSHCPHCNIRAVRRFICKTYDMRDKK